MAHKIVVKVPGHHITAGWTFLFGLSFNPAVPRKMAGSFKKLESFKYFSKKLFLITIRTP